MKVSNAVLLLAVVPGVVSHPHFLRKFEGQGLDGDVDLNTASSETAEQRERRLLFSFMFQTDETVAPHDETEDIFLEELYNPMIDAKCFNDRYDVPSHNKHELYRDYKKIFDWGLTNPPESPIFDVSENGVTNNRFPGMCLRMAFHDNTIRDGVSGPQFVGANIDANGVWTGPDLMMETSGGDASLLVCKPERYHPNNNYDQTASRVLHAFQSTANYPYGPSIGGHGESLMSKYGMSYADALHNCALAAIKYMTEPDVPTDLEITLSDKLLGEISGVYHKFSFGRKDACYFTNNQDLVNSDGLGANSRRPLCGPSDILPGVTLSARGVNDWFVSRGMQPGTFLSLFGTHTALDNFGSLALLRYFGVPDKDYFEDFIGCPFHQLTPPVTDPEDGGCNWTPVCKNPSNTNQEPWFLVQSDCAMGIDIIDEANDPSLDEMRRQLSLYECMPGTWLVDIICALSHLGGNDETCQGKFSFGEATGSLFGSVWKNDYPLPSTHPVSSTCRIEQVGPDNSLCCGGYSTAQGDRTLTKEQCSALCLADDGCTGTQYGSHNNYWSTSTYCDLMMSSQPYACGYWSAYSCNIKIC